MLRRYFRGMTQTMDQATASALALGCTEVIDCVAQTGTRVITPAVIGTRGDVVTPAVTEPIYSEVLPSRYAQAAPALPFVVVESANQAGVALLQKVAALTSSDEVQGVADVAKQPYPYAALIAQLKANSLVSSDVKSALFIALVGNQEGTTPP